MKQLKSRSQDLGSLFENSITIEYVAEPLKAVKADADMREIINLTYPGNSKYFLMSV